MHQPFYKDLVTGEYVLPWVRLHAIKDYYDIAAILDDFPYIKQTFNLVPSLLEQLEDYVGGTAMDKHLRLTLKDPSALTHEEKVFMLQNFFMANWDTMVKPYKRYFELLLKRGRFVSLEEIKAVARRFSDPELMDLQIWFTLTWFGHISKSRDPDIKRLLDKGRDFSPEDKSMLLSKQRQLMGKVIPKYKELWNKDQIELTVTPYYHPILPLLVDTNSAKDAVPGIALPEQRFRHPEDAKYQINEAVSYMEKLFGKRPEGMWPSEGSVSEAIIPLVAGAGIKWIATDEEILAMSFGRKAGQRLASHELFKPYVLEREGGNLNIIFRDHALSDLIGFVYSKWNPRDAAADFISHLKGIRSSLPDDGNRYLVSIILDGENAWEYYRNNGWDFLSELYTMLSSDKQIRTTRVIDFLRENPPSDRLHSLFSGSWINHNFRIWIGHSEDNKAWDYLNAARLALDNSKTIDPLAWKELYISEGSDWCWWYGDDHSSDNDETFDQLYRKHLKNIYHLINRPAPNYLDFPIKQLAALKPSREPVDLITPVLDGEVTNFYEWLSAGYFDIGKLKGAMHQAETLIKGIYYGFDVLSLHLRLDMNLDLSNHECRDFKFSIVFYHPKNLKVTASHDSEKNRCMLSIYRLEGEEWVFVRSADTVAMKTIFEASVPFEEIGAKVADEIQFVVIIERDSQELERWPRGGSITFKVPEHDFADKQWSA